MVSVQDVIDFENGDLEVEDTIQMFQELVDSGLVWQLQGFYGRFAADLIEQGLVTNNRTD